MTRLKILGKSWRLVHSPIPDDNLVHYGQTDHLAGQIVVNSRATPHQRLDTTIHEVIHVIDGELKLGLSEGNVSRLSSALCGVILDNPRLFQAKDK